MSIMRCKILKIIVSTFTGLVLLALSIVLFVVLFGFQGTKPATPCAGSSFGTVTYYHRGNTLYAQENTYDSLVTGTAEKGNNVELDVSALADGGTVVFHDKNMIRMTGNNQTIKDVTTKEASSAIIVSEIDGYNYNSTNSIPELQPIAEAICNANVNVGINFDIKDINAVKSSIEAYTNSNCTSTNENPTIWSTPYPNVVTLAQKELKNANLDNLVAVYMPPGEYYFLGLKFMMKTRFYQGLLGKGSSIIEFTKVVFDKEKELIQSWADDGWCIGIYDITAYDIPNYKADIYIIDNAPVFPALNGTGLSVGGDGEPKRTVYEDDSLLWYYVFIVVAVLLLIISLSIGCYVIKICYNNNNDDDDDNDNDDNMEKAIDSEYSDGKHDVETAIY